MPPSKLQSLLQDALAHHRAGRLAEAEKLYARVRATAPTHFDAQHLSGVVALQQGRHADAIELLRRALKLNPKSALCEMRLGIALVATGDAVGAERHLRAAVARDPRLVDGWSQLTIFFRRQGRLPEAREAAVKVVELAKSAEAHETLGAIVSELAGFAASVPHFRAAVEVNPQFATGWASLGLALAQSGGADEALTCFERALALEPLHPQALTGRALVFQELHRIAEAVEAYGEVLAKHPQHHEARSARLFALQYLDTLSPERFLAEHRTFGTAVGEASPRAWPNRPEPERRLRLAFLSPDLRAHSVAYFLEPLLAHLDRAQFEIFLYHDHPKVDAVSARLRGYASVWRQFGGLSQRVVEETVRTDAPDVLVDLAGHTGFNRLPLFARRLAPVQISYLGYPDTTGVMAMDYRFVDEVTDPIGVADAFHTEKLVRFAPTMWSYLPSKEAPEPVRQREGREGVVFGCFNNLSKVSDTALRLWAEVLHVVSGSRMLLKGRGLDDPRQQARIRERFAQRGIGPERIEMLGRTSGAAAHLAHYARVDVALDTFPYHGTTTTCEALWMGVPVVTLAGDRHAARVGASLLSAIGHPEWAAANSEDYVRIAARLANDSESLARLRSSLRSEVSGSPLCDHVAQARRFGAALRECWQQWCHGISGGR